MAWKHQRKYVLKGSHEFFNEQLRVLEFLVSRKSEFKTLYFRNMIYYRFHEMGIFDLPAMTDLILKESGHTQLSYVGHSMGTTMFFVFCSMHPELQSRIREMHALAPVVFTSRCRSPIRAAASIEHFLEVRWCEISRVAAHHSLVRFADVPQWSGSL